MSDKSAKEIKKEAQYKTISNFLESTPPNQFINISDLVQAKPQISDYSYIMRTPEVQLHCINDQ